MQGENPGNGQGAASMMDAARVEEVLARLINIELKINALAGGTSSQWQGHPDQAFGHLTYAQHGEDLIILNLFHRLGIRQPSYLDIGAHHPINISNTALLYQMGSRGINIEANPDLIAAFKEKRPEDINLNIGVGPASGKLPFYRVDDFSGRNSFNKDTVEAFVREHPAFRINDVVHIEVRTLAQVLDQYANGQFPNFLSIDVEGMDYAILESADFTRSRPDIICAEIVSGADSDDSGRMRQLMASRGFVQVFETIGNAFYAARDVSERLGVQ